MTTATALRNCPSAAYVNEENGLTDAAAYYADRAGRVEYMTRRRGGEMTIEEEPIQVEDIVDFWVECRAAGDKRWTKLAHRALHGSVDDPVTSDAWEYVAEEIIKRREREARLYDMRH